MSKDSVSVTKAEWPSEIPKSLKNVEMEMSVDGKFITCLACQLYNDRKFSKNGVVSCAHGRIFKFDSMLAHVKNDYHTRSMKMQQVDNEGAILSADQFRKKYGKDFVKWKKETTMTNFFHLFQRNQNILKM